MFWKRKRASERGVAFLKFSQTQKSLDSSVDRFHMRGDDMFIIACL
jgi:hypothetical protein